MDIKELDKLGQRIAALKISKSQLAEQTKKINEELNPLEDEYIEKLTEAEKKNWLIKGVGTFVLKVSEYVNVSAEQKDKVVQYFLKKKDYHMLDLKTGDLSDWAKKEREIAKNKAKFDADFKKKFGITFFDKTSLAFTRDKKKE